LFAIFPAVI